MGPTSRGLASTRTSQQPAIQTAPLSSPIERLRTAPTTPASAAKRLAAPTTACRVPRIFGCRESHDSPPTVRAAPASPPTNRPGSRCPSTSRLIGPSTMAPAAAPNAAASASDAEGMRLSGGGRKGVERRQPLPERQLHFRAEPAGPHDFDLLALQPVEHLGQHVGGGGDHPPCDRLL